MAPLNQTFGLDAMNVEMQLMQPNKVWKLVDSPETIKLVGCKWIYKKKKSPGENLETFKARHSSGLYPSLYSYLMRSCDFTAFHSLVNLAFVIKYFQSS